MNALLALLTMMAILTGGCAFTMQERMVNAKLFPSPEALKEKVSALKEGETLEENLAALGLNTDPSKVPNLELLEPGPSWLELHGKSFFQPGNDFPSYDVYGLPVSGVEKLGSLRLPPSVKIRLKGFDLKLILAYHNKGMKFAKLKGRAIVDEKEIIWIWNILDNVFEGGAKQAGKETIKSLF